MVPEGLDVAQRGAAQERLEFGEELLDWIQVGRVRRQVANGRAGGLDGFAHTGNLMAGQVVGNDHVAGTQGGAEKLLHVGEEGGAVHGSIDDQRGGDGIAAQCGDEGGGLPVPVRRRPEAALSAWRAPAGGGHRRVDPGLVEEHQPGAIQPALGAAPLSPSLLHVGAFLLAGVQRFF